MKKRVLYHIKSLASGGAQRQLLYTALAAERDGYDVKIVLDFPVVHYEKMLERSRIEVVVACHHSTMHRSAKRILTLSGLMKTYKPHIVHSFLGKSNLYGMLMAKLHRVPVKIASIRDTNDKAFEYARIYRHWADKIICNSRLAADIALREYGVPERKIAVVYNAIDLRRFKEANSLPDLKSSLDLPECTRLGVTVGRIAEQKNPLGLVRSLKILAEQGLLEKVHYLFVGDTEGNSPLCKKVTDEMACGRISGKVTIMGIREDVPEILKTCDFMVLPSFHEGFPNVVLEAMAAGVFVIASPTGGTPELVEHGVNGLLTGGCDPDDLGASIREYLEMGEEGRQAILRAAAGKVGQFDQGVAFDRIFDLYEER